MSERILTLTGSTDQFVVIDRPAATLTLRYRALPDGMNVSHLVVAQAHQVRAGDVVVAFFSNGPGTRHATHVAEAFVADPHHRLGCPCQGCEACEDNTAHGVTADRYTCLAPSDDVADCFIVFHNAPVAIVPADVAAQFPPLHSTPPLPDLFTIDDGTHGPYEALPVSRTWGPYDAISVTRETAEQLVTDLRTSNAGRHLTCRWAGEGLVITSDTRFRTEPGLMIVEPDAEGRYRIGGLWPWEQWPADDDTDA
ncbi:hypothetical protein ABZ864_40860 [Streptomyces sp. NPDC047082]|uniref:hypothetical protein n=1 Tax=Streptomyces sp. NPDC047082 TaxID=3155259 RepID=UPI0033DFAA59